MRFMECRKLAGNKGKKKWEAKASHLRKNKMEKLFSAVRFGIFVFHHKLHNAD